MLVVRRLWIGLTVALAAPAGAQLEQSRRAAQNHANHDAEARR